MSVTLYLAWIIVAYGLINAGFRAYSIDGGDRVFSRVIAIFGAVTVIPGIGYLLGILWSDGLKHGWCL